LIDPGAESTKDLDCPSPEVGILRPRHFLFIEVRDDCHADIVSCPSGHARQVSIGFRVDVIEKRIKTEFIGREGIFALLIKRYGYPSGFAKAWRQQSTKIYGRNDIKWSCEAK
jgi:hypothetical protein